MATCPHCGPVRNEAAHKRAYPGAFRCDRPVGHTGACTHKMSDGKSIPLVRQATEVPPEVPCLQPTVGDRKKTDLRRNAPPPNKKVEVTISDPMASLEEVFDLLAAQARGYRALAEEYHSRLADLAPKVDENWTNLVLVGKALGRDVEDSDEYDDLFVSEDLVPRKKDLPSKRCGDTSGASTCCKPVGHDGRHTDKETGAPWEDVQP